MKHVPDLTGQQMRLCRHRFLIGEQKAHLFPHIACLFRAPEFLGECFEVIPVIAVFHKHDSFGFQQRQDFHPVKRSQCVQQIHLVGFRGEAMAVAFDHRTQRADGCGGNEVGRMGGDQELNAFLRGEPFENAQHLDLQARVQVGVRFIQQDERTALGQDSR